MKDFHAKQTLIESRIEDNHVTAYYAIKLENNTGLTINHLSIQEQLGHGIDFAKAKLTSHCKCVQPISDSSFVLKSNDELLDTSSKLLAGQCCILYLTIEFQIDDDNQAAIINCAIINGKFKDKCRDRREQGLFEGTENKCQGEFCTVKVCSDPIIILGRGKKGEKGNQGPAGEKGKRGHEGAIGPTGPAGESTISFISVTETKSICSGEDHVAIIPDHATTSINASISIGPKPNSTGFLSAEAPTPGSVIGGDCRGVNAVDWQMHRQNPNQVASGRIAVIGGGDSNIASGIASTVSGGITNAALANQSSIGGGNNNTIFAGAADSTIGGGSENIISQVTSTIGGGIQNITIGPVATIGGGSSNTAGITSVVAGGIRNQALSPASTVGGGNTNIAAAPLSTVSGGVNNSANGVASVIGGGDSNYTGIGKFTYRGKNLYGHNTVCGGGYNSALGYSSVVSGGTHNIVVPDLSFIGGGQFNQIQSELSVLGGGFANLATGRLSVIGGGSGNKTTGNYATVSGGQLNIAAGRFSTVTGGHKNSANAVYSTVSGGNQNIASGYFSWAGGNQATASDYGSFVWGNKVKPYTSQGTNTVVMGGIHGKTTKLAATTVVIDANGQLGTISSSLKYKENVINLVDELPSKLDSLSSLEPVQFNFKSNPDKSIEYGLIAEQVHKFLPELVTYKEDEIHSVRYHLLIPLLLGEVIRLRSDSETAKKEMVRLNDEINKLKTTF